MTTRRGFLGALAAVAVVRPDPDWRPGRAPLDVSLDALRADPVLFANAYPDSLKGGHYYFGANAWEPVEPPSRERFMLERRLLRERVGL